MNFTKQYIKECDCKEIQELRPKIKIGDWTVFNNKIEIVRIEIESPNVNNFMRGGTSWLPTGDQLDDEIIKYCKGKNGYYEFNFIDRTHPNKFFRSYFSEVDIPSDNKHIEIRDNNPLIAKIKLLKALLKETL